MTFSSMTLRLLGVVLVAVSSACNEPRVLVTRSVGPAQRTINAMRAMYDEEITRCELPVVAKPVAGVSLVSIDSGVRIQLPNAWPSTTAPDTTRSLPQMVWSDDHRRSVGIAHEMNGLTGPTFLGPASHPIRTLPTCAVTDGDAGVIWRRYDPVPPDTSARPFLHIAFGEVITRDSLRYRIDLSAVTAPERDSLASWVSLAVLAPARP